jgi:molybdopterin molybdotransferase
MNKLNFITVARAEKALRENYTLFPRVKVNLRNCCPNVLRENIIADRACPPFNRVMMDGVAISYESYRRGRRKFTITGIQKAGQKPLTIHSQQDSIEVMTGSVLPHGCDCVIPYEQIIISGKMVAVPKGLNLQIGQNIHSQGRDFQKGEVLFKEGERLTPSHLAILAAIGKVKVTVSRTPKIAVIDTGDELVPVASKLKPYQIRRSNSLVVSSALKEHGFTRVSRCHLRDDHVELLNAIKRVLEGSDILLISGGVSMGKWDLIPDVLKELKIKIVFHMVRQRPGKPLLFAKGRDGKYVFGLPGNSVSAQVMIYRYVLPFLRKICGAKVTRREYAKIQQCFIPRENMTYFQPVILNSDRKGYLKADLLPLSCSGDFTTFAKADGFVEFPARRGFFPKGYAARVFRIKN